ncbi:hypothetical protein [Ruminococcus sp.]
MKSKRKLRFLIPLFCIVLSLVIYRFANGLMREREFQHMPEIYEIPDTSQVFTQNNVTTVRTNYIIKSEYTDLDLLHQKVQDFIYDNDIINTSVNCSKTEEYYINLRFYRISEQLPFDFEQMPGFGGDVIENHMEDLIARVSVYSDSPDQLSYKLWNRTENDKDGYNDVIEERSFYEALRDVAS